MLKSSETSGEENSTKMVRKTEISVFELVGDPLMVIFLGFGFNNSDL